MIKKNYKPLSLTVGFWVAASVTEFDENAKKEGACLAEGNSNVIYRGTMAVFRDVFLHGQKEEKNEDGTVKQVAIAGVEQITGIERLTKPVLDKNKNQVVKDGEAVTEYDESEKDYFDRVLATLVTTGKYGDEDAARASFQSLADSVGDMIPFDASASERKATGPRKLAAKYKLAAAKSLALGTVQKVNDNMLSKIGKSFTPTNDTEKLFTGKYPHKDGEGRPIEVDFSVSDKDAEAYGWLIKEHQDWKANQELAVLND